MHKETEQRIRDMLEQGHDPEYIAAELELKPGTVMTVQKKHGQTGTIRLNRQHYPQDLIDEWDRLHRKYGNKGGGQGDAVEKEGEA